MRKSCIEHDADYSWLLAGLTLEERYALLKEQPISSFNPLRQALMFRKKTIIPLLVDGLDLARIRVGLGKNFAPVLSEALCSNLLDWQALVRGITLEEKYALLEEQISNPLHEALLLKNRAAVEFLIEGLEIGRICNALGCQLSDIVQAALASGLLDARWLLGTRDERLAHIKEQRCDWDNFLYRAINANSQDAVSLLLEGLTLDEVRTAVGKNWPEIEHMARLVNFDLTAACAKSADKK